MYEIYFKILKFKYFVGHRLSLGHFGRQYSLLYFTWIMYTDAKRGIFFWFKMRTNWWHWWTWHGNSKRRDEKEKNKRVMPLKALSSLHWEFIVKDSWQFLLLIKMTNMKFFFQLFWLWTWVEIITIKAACLSEEEEEGICCSELHQEMSGNFSHVKWNFPSRNFSFFIFFSFSFFFL